MTPHVPLPLVAALSLASLPISLATAEPPPADARVEYAVSLADARTQMVNVTILVSGLEADQEHLDFVMPAWRPGKYAILDLAGAVRAVEVVSGCGEALVAEKIAKDTWRVPTGGHDLVQFDYRVYANALADRTRHADDSHAFLSGAGAFMYVEGLRDRPATVRIDLPDGWRVATGLPARDGAPDTFTAATYDVLVDSPLEIGLHDLMTFDVDGVPHEIAVWGRGAYDPQEMTADFAKIVRAQRDIFGDLPYDRYVYIIHSYPGGAGGTEHLNSTVMQASPAAFDTPESYRKFLGLVSHEMFHTWNVKQFRPAGITPYDYQRENYTRLLWVAEGTTSYYDDLTLVRTGIVKPNDYLKTLAGSIGALRARPGREVQSLEESSFDAWIKFNKATPDSVNSTVSFYDKGALVSFLLDLQLRLRTEGRVSLDSAMRELYRRFPLSGPGFTPEDVQRLVEELSESDLDAFFADYVRGTTELDFESALGVIGLQLARKPKDDDKDKDKDKDDTEGADDSTTTIDAPSDMAASEDEQEEPATKPYIGLTLKDDNGLAIVSTVLADGPAYRAGVIAGDAIAAMDGLRLRAADLDTRLKALDPGDTVRLSLFRYDRLRDIEFTLAATPTGDWKLERVKDPTDEQRAAYESWLGQPWPKS